MWISALSGGGPFAYRGPRTVDARQRMTAVGAVLALHGAVLGGFAWAQLHKPPPPPEPTIEVSFISEASASGAPSAAPPPPPPPPPPEERLMASPRPTPSPMTAPPLEETPRRDPVPQQTAAAPAPSPAPSAPAATASASSAAPGPTGEPSITPPNFTAAYLNNPVVYPVSARRRRDEGTVRLKVLVSADGNPEQVLLDRTSGHSELDSAALDLVKKRWRFVPAKQGDHTVSAWVIVPVAYELKAR